MTVDDIVYGRKKAPVEKHALDYSVPSTYLHRNKQEETKTAPDKKSLAPDGPVYSIGKSLRANYMKAQSFGKDGKEPPHSYLALRQWYPKKDDKVVVKPKVYRKTYIDAVFEYNNKHKYPSPDHYFKDEKKKKEEDKKVEAKKAPRPCFLDDCQYLGMNFPGPGSYEIQKVTLLTCSKN